MSFPRISRAVRGILAGAMLFGSVTVGAVEIAGAKIDESAQVAGQTLKLNGAGIRYKVFFKVYVAALYLPGNKTTTADVLAQPGPKRISLNILRDLRSEDLGQRFIEGIRKNADMAERTRLMDSMLALGQMFSQLPDMKKGDVVDIDSVPGTGTTAQFNGKRIGAPIADPLFYNALLKIWLGNHPVDEKLKQALLNSSAE